MYPSHLKGGYEARSEIVAHDVVGAAIIVRCKWKAVRGLGEMTALWVRRRRCTPRLWEPEHVREKIRGGTGEGILTAETVRIDHLLRGTLVDAIHAIRVLQSKYMPDLMCPVLPERTYLGEF